MIDKLCKTFRASKKNWLCRWSLRNAIDLSMERLTPTFGVELKTYSVVRFFLKWTLYIYMHLWLCSFMEYLLWLMFDITEKEKKIRTEFFFSPSLLHGWGNLFAKLHETLPCPITRKKCKYKNNVRRCLFKCVQVYIINIYIWFIIQIGETGVVYTRSRRKEVQLAMEGRSAILTQRVRTQIWKSLLWSCISYKK